MALTDDDKHWITEQLERVETRLLTEFHRWASPVTDRVKRLESGEKDKQ